MTQTTPNVRTPPDGFRPIEVSDHLWQVGMMFYWSTAWDDGSWYDQQHFISVKPGETWREAYVKNTKEEPNENQYCFVPENM